MYLDFYRLKEKAFSLSPNPKFLFYSESHKEAISQMIFALKENYGFMVLTGEVGTGKTTLVNALINLLPKHYSVAKILRANTTPKGLIHNICKEFGLSINKFPNYTLSDLIFRLQEYLRWGHLSGRKSLLIIDEANGLNANVLEEIRSLSNFESEKEKFLQIIFVGQTELDETLQKSHLRQLKERINLRYTLKKLNRDETKSYVNYRLYIAGRNSSGDLFNENAINNIYTLSKGIPRRINVICENALLVGYAKNLRKIDDRIIESVGVDDFYRKKQVVSVKKTVVPNNSNNGNINLYSDKVISIDAKLDKLFSNIKKIKSDQHSLSSNGKGKLNYSEFQDLLTKYLEEKKLFLIEKPKFITVLFGSILLFFILLILFTLFLFYFMDKI